MGKSSDPEGTSSEVFDLVARVTELTVTGECPVCTDNQWIGLGELIALPGPAKTYSCVGLACKNCGYVRLHSLNALNTQF